MTEAKSLVQQALDVLLYAPLGLAVTAAEELPELIDKGRARVAPEISNARVLGKFAVAHGQRRAEQFVTSAAERIAGFPDGVSSGPSGRPGAPSEGPRGRPDVGSAAAREEAPPTPEARGSQDLAIPRYDSLSASQVVQRLAGLSPEELDAVRAYEASTRRRKTILNRATQLRSAGGR